MNTRKIPTGGGRGTTRDIHGRLHLKGAAKMAPPTPPRAAARLGQLDPDALSHIGVTVSDPVPQSRFVGTCPQCQAPVAVDDEQYPYDTKPFRCLLCNTLIQLQRIYGVYTQIDCNMNCMAAFGPVCECACGGMNHSARFVVRDEMTAEELAAYRELAEQHIAAMTSRREAAAQTRRRRGQERLATLIEAYPEIGDVIDVASGEQWVLSFLRQVQNRTPSEEAIHEFVQAARQRLDYETKRPLYERIMNAADKNYLANRQVEDLVKQWSKPPEIVYPPAPFPKGPEVDEEVTIINHRWEDRFFQGRRTVSHKMLVQGPGWRMWVTCPKDLDPTQQQRIRLKAKVQPSWNDPHFGFGTFPKAIPVSGEREFPDGSKRIYDKRGHLATYISPAGDEVHYWGTNMPLLDSGYMNKEEGHDVHPAIKLVDGTEIYAYQGEVHRRQQDAPMAKLADGTLIYGSEKQRRVIGPDGSETVLDQGVPTLHVTPEGQKWHKNHETHQIDMFHIFTPEETNPTD